jgi:hypothetical protein
MDCPRGLKAVPVSTTVRPVTQTAEVEVKRAFTNPRGSPVDAKGIISRIVPIKITIANPIITVRAGDRTMDSEIRMEVFLALNLIKILLMGCPRQLSKQKYGRFTTLYKFVHFAFRKHFRQQGVFSHPQCHHRPTSLL